MNGPRFSPGHQGPRTDRSSLPTHLRPATRRKGPCGCGVQGGFPPPQRGSCPRSCSRRSRRRSCRRCGFPDRPSSGSRLLSGGLFPGRFLRGLLQRLPFPFLSCCSPFFLFLCRFLASSLLCHDWPPSRVMKQRTRPLRRGLFNRRGKPRRIEFLSCPAEQQVLVQNVGIELELAAEA